MCWLLNAGEARMWDMQVYEPVLTKESVVHRIGSLVRFPGDTGKVLPPIIAKGLLLCRRLNALCGGSGCDQRLCRNVAA